MLMSCLHSFSANEPGEDPREIIRRRAIQQEQERARLFAEMTKTPAVFMNERGTITIEGAEPGAVVSFEMNGKRYSFVAPERPVSSPATIADLEGLSA